MKLLTFNDIPLPNRMTSYDTPRTAKVGRFDVVGGASYALNVRFGTQEYGMTGLYYSTVDGWVRDEVVDQLRSSMGSVGILRGETASGEIRRCNAYLTGINPANDMESFAANVQRCELKFEAEPYWYSDVVTLGVLSTSSVIYAVNTGNADAILHLTIKITSFLNSGLVITNTSNGMTLTYGATKAAGLILLVDAGAGGVTANGVNVYENVTIPATQIELMALAPKKNKITFSQPVTGEIRYRGCWI